MAEETEYTTMRISRKNLARLKQHGVMGDSPDDALGKVLDKAEG